MVLVLLVDELLRLAVRGKVIGHQVVIAVLDDAVDEGGEGAGVAKRSLLDLVEDFGERFVELVVAVNMSVAEIVDVFGEVAEEEDVLLADLAGDFDLSKSAPSLMEWESRCTHIGTITCSDN